MPVAFVPVSQPVNVGTGGITVEVNPPESRDDLKISRIVVLKTAGSATKYDVKVGSKKAGDESIPAENIIAEYKDATAALPVDDDNYGNGFTWEPEDTIGGKVFVRILPDAGSNNSFHVIIFIRRP